jgi:16S rRNA processing protein RimM
MASAAASDRGGLVAVGRVTKPHGIRGEFCVESHADSPLLFAPGRTVFLALPEMARPRPGPSGKAPQPGKAAQHAASSAKAARPGKPVLARPKAFEVATMRTHGDRLLLTFKGIADRNFAETLRGAEVLVAEADLPEPDEGEVYLHALLGCRVLLADGTPVGIFESILNTPAHDTWVIRAANGREVLFPAVPEFFVSLDPDKGEIRIDPPAGLIELYMTGPEGAALEDEDPFADLIKD